MAFWSSRIATPKLSYQWVATLGSFRDKIETYSLKSFNKPSFEVTVSQYMNINDVKYRPGVLTWNPIEIVLVDGANRKLNNSSIIYQIMKASGYGISPSGQPQHAILKKKASEALGGQVRFSQLDSMGGVVEEWVLWDPFITKVAFGNASYTTDELMTINLTISYDYAVLEGGKLSDSLLDVDSSADQNPAVQILREARATAQRGVNAAGDSWSKLQAADRSSGTLTRGSAVLRNPMSDTERKGPTSP